MSIFKNVSSQQIPVWKVRVPIRIKITIPYLMLSLVLAVAAAYLITQVVIENMEERFNKQLYEQIYNTISGGYFDRCLLCRTSKKESRYTGAKSNIKF